MQIGLIGKTNVGKSTFFSASTLTLVPIANHPFTTIEPNIGIAYVRVDCVCKEFGVKDNPVRSICINGNRFIPIKLIDVAGLVPLAHQGRGLGNKFLDHARQADALIHVVDASGSTDSEGRECPPGTHDPLEDVRFVEEEFDLWLYSKLNKDWNKIVREVEHRSTNLEELLADKLSGLSIKKEHVKEALKQFNDKKISEWKESDLLKFTKELRRVSKPMIIAANKADIRQAEHNIERLKSLGIVIPCSAEAELVLRLAARKGIVEYIPGDPYFKIKDSNISNEQRIALEKVRVFLNRYGSTGVQKIINYVTFNLLKMIVVYPVENSDKLSDKKGNVLPDAYLVKEGTTAKELAYIIHTELGDNFLYAIDARSKKRLGADYRLKNNDVIQVISSK